MPIALRCANIFTPVRAAAYCFTGQKMYERIPLYAPNILRRDIGTESTLLVYLS